MAPHSGSPGGRCTLAWGPLGATIAAERGDVVVIVDTLSFSTAVAAAVTYGASVYPCATHDDAPAMAAHVNAQSAVHREKVPSRGRFSLSPRTYLGISPGTRVVLPSVNGGGCTLAALAAPVIFTASLVNASATAAVLDRLMQEDPRRGTTIVACGEQQFGGAGSLLRFAVEDLIGAGAIITSLRCVKAPEAAAAEGAFRHLRNRLEDALLGSTSGRELCDLGFGDDVRFAAKLDAYPVVASLRDGCFGKFQQPRNV